MLLNKTNIKNKSIQMLLPIEVLNDVSLANKFIWKPENTEILRQIVKLEEGRLAYFKDSPITSIMDLMEYSESVYDMLSDWDKDFLSDMLDRNMYSIKQKALLLRICSSVNYAMWKNKIPKETLKKKEKEDMFTVKEIRNKSYNVDNVKEEELTDETELIEKFEILKNNFDDIMESNLFDHQVISVNFLMTRENGSGIIGSSTGLGKTVVATTYSEQLFSEGKINHTYVIAPLAMIETWKREIIKHTKAKDLSRYTIINYEKLLSLKLSNTEQSLVVLDECLTGDTKIKTKSGLKDIKWLVKNNKIGTKVLSYNHTTERMEYKEITNVFNQGIKKIMELQFDNGKIIKCTENHLFYTRNRGYVQAKDLSEDDDILEYNEEKNSKIYCKCGCGELKEHKQYIQRRKLNEVD